MPNTFAQDPGGGNWSAAASWSLGAVPAAGDSVYLLTGLADFNTGLPALGLAYAILYVGREFAGSIGSNGNPLQLGTISKVVFDGLRTKWAFLEADTTDTIADVFVNSTIGGANAIVLSRNGTGKMTRVRVRGGTSVQLAAASEVTRLIVEAGAPGARVDIVSGAVLGYAQQGAGVVDCRAALANELHVVGGVWNHLGATAFNVPTIIVAHGATLNLWCDGGTFTDVYNFGMVNCNGGQGKPRTITNYWDCGGTLDLRALGSTVTITNRYKSGGLILEH